MPCATGPSTDGSAAFTWNGKVQCGGGTIRSTDSYSFDTNPRHESMTNPSPAASKILLATAVALAVALIILFVAILPAEYGVDPLRTGRLLGLLGLAEVEEEPLTVARGVTTSQTDAYKVDSIEIRLRPGRSVEYKYHLDTGSGLVYSWLSNGRVIYDFHGQPDG